MRKRLTLVILAIALPLTTADAQFGGLIKRAVGGQVADRMGVGEKKGPIEVEQVEFSDLVIEITSPRIDQLIRGMKAEQNAMVKWRRDSSAFVAKSARDLPALEARRKDYPRVEALFRKKLAAYDKCVASMVAGGMAAWKKAESAANPPADIVMAKQMMKLPSEDRDRLTARQDELQASIAEAEKANDRRKVDALTRQYVSEIARALDMSEADVRKAIDQSTAAAAKAERNGEGAGKCGTQPEGPEYPADPSFPLATVGEVTEKAGVDASGLPERQHHVLRERIAAFIRKAPYAFTKAELQVLGAREAQLKEYEALLTAEVR